MMPTTIHTISSVPENELQDLIKDLRELDHVDIVTAINDGKGAFTVEATVFEQAAAGGAEGISQKGKMSVFGGPNDHGVGPDEGLAIFDPPDVNANPDLFLPTQPSGTTGLARRLNPDAMYIACRWDYSVTPKSFLKTIKVKVTNTANNQSRDARPADWGPNVATGRVADLSPGLAAALGLVTDKECQVQIPTPAGTQPPPAGAGAPADTNLAAIDSTIFPQDMTRALAVMTTSNDKTFWVTNQVGQNEGGQTLLRNAKNKTDILLSDTTVFPVKASDQIPAAVAEELNKAAPELGPPGQGGNPPQPDDDINAKEFTTAKAFVGHDTSDVPGTEGGNLACAWAVNEVTRLALGKPISTDGGRNGLSTDGIFDALKAHHTKLNSANDATAGVVIIAPTVGKNHGHVGIVGENKQVFSNKSVPGVFAQNFTIQSFTSHYTGKGLQVLFFALKRDQF
jgi:hypothetical protein